MIELRGDTLPARSNVREKYCVVNNYIQDEHTQLQEIIEMILQIDYEDQGEWNHTEYKQYEVEHSHVDFQSM